MKINADVMYAQMETMGRLLARMGLACTIASVSLMRLHKAEHPTARSAVAS